MVQKVVFLLVGVCASVSTWGQPAPIHSAIHYRVKPDRMTEWQDLRKQLVAIYKKAGLEYNQLVWQSQSGPMEYVVTRGYAKFADIGQGPNPKLKDSAAEVASLNSRMMSCVESMSRDLGRVSEVSYGLDLAPAPMIRVLRSTVRLGHMDDYMNLIKNEVAPAYKKAGFKTYIVITPALGSADVISGAPMSWADMDGPNPLAKALGQDGSAALIKKLDAHLTRRAAEMYRFMPELSYIAARP
jgi:hypothetical protein